MLDASPTRFQQYDNHRSFRREQAIMSAAVKIMGSDADMIHLAKQNLIRDIITGGASGG